LIIIGGSHIQITAEAILNGYFLAIILTSGVSAMLLYYLGLKHTKASVSTICELGLPLSSIIFDGLLYHKPLT
jgi:drug/metabolite transporter (DMT)-like permease